MSDSEIWAAAIGFVFGYVGWYPALRLVPMVATFVLAPWKESGSFARAITLVIVGIFAITTMIGLLAVGVELVAIASPLKPRLLAVALLFSFLGLVFLGILGTTGRYFTARRLKRARR